MTVDVGRYRVKLAGTEAERAGAQRLRYRVFVEEMGAKTGPEQRMLRREWDAYDAFSEYLVLLDRQAGSDPVEAVVGAYRLMTGEAARQGIGFYGEAEFDLSVLKAGGRAVLELGRSCVAREHRGGPGMHLLWNALAAYVLGGRIEVLFGLASFPGTDPGRYAEALSHLHRAHLAPDDLRVRALPERAVAMNMMPAERVDAERAMRTVPPLIKAYLRVGGFVGEGAVVDREFNTVDVCLIMDTGRMVERYRSFYARARELRR